MSANFMSYIVQNIYIALAWILYLLHFSPLPLIQKPPMDHNSTNSSEALCTAAFLSEKALKRDNHIVSAIPMAHKSSVFQKNVNILKYIYFACSFMWAWNMVSDTERRTQAEGVQ